TKLMPASRARWMIHRVLVIRGAPGTEHHRSEAERTHLDASAPKRPVLHPRTVSHRPRAHGTSTWQSRPAAFQKVCSLGDRRGDVLRAPADCGRDVAGDGLEHRGVVVD